MTGKNKIAIEQLIQKVDDLESAGQVDGLIAEYLGSEATAGGPFALLGLRYEPIDEGIIFEACQVRLGQINGHRRSQTPDADEVRLAVHAAASQLLDSSLREELAKHWPEGAGEIQSMSNAPEAWKVEESAGLDEEIRNQVLRLVGACGGWNARSRKRLGQFARMHQVSAANLVQAIVGEREESEGDRGGFVQSLVRGPSLVDPTEGALPWVMIPVAYVLMGLALVSVGYVKYLDHWTGPMVVAGGGVESGSSAGGGVNDQRGKSDTKASVRRHFSGILFELEQIERDGVFDVESGARFAEVGARLGEQWTEFSAEELDRAVGAVRGVLGGILNQGVFDVASGFLRIEDGVDESVVLPALRGWLFGSLDQGPVYALMSERGEVIDLDGAFGRRLEDSIRVEAKLSRDDGDWWKWWLRQLEPMAERSTEGFVESMIFEAAYQRLIEEYIGDAWNESARRIVQGVDWGDRSAARSWLMGVVVDPKVRSDRLAVLTRALVVHSSAGGIGVDMVIYKGDSIVEREAFLGRLREQWAGGSGAEDGVRVQLVERIELLMRMTQNSVGRDQAMIRGIELARLNSACFARSVDDEPMLHGLIGAFDAPMDAGKRVWRVFDLSSSASDERWATNARNLEDREALFTHLKVLDRSTEIGPKSAHALVYLAMQAPDLEVRAMAERAMLARRDSATILIALDRVAGASRTTRRMVELINGYVGREGDLGDSASARRALLERLVAIGILDTGDEGGVDGFSQALFGLYSLRRTSGAGVGGVGGVGGARGAYEDALFRRMADGHEVPDSVRVGLMVRMRLARGPIQVFVAYQSAGLELFAAEMIEDRPAVGGRIEGVLDGLNQRLRNENDAVVQIMLVERALAELWLIVLEFEGVS